MNGIQPRVIGKIPELGAPYGSAPPVQMELFPKTGPDRFVALGPSSSEPRWSVWDRKTNTVMAWFKDPNHAVRFTEAMNQV